MFVKESVGIENLNTSRELKFMDQKIEKDLEMEIAGNQETKRLVDKVAEILKSYGINKYDQKGIVLLMFVRAAKQYGLEFVEPVIKKSLEGYRNMQMETRISLLPGQLRTALTGIQKVNFTVVYEGPVFSHKPRDNPNGEEIRGKSVVVLIDDELYVIIARQDKVEIPFIHYHKYVGYGKFVVKNGDKTFYLNSSLPVSDVGEVDERPNLEELMSKGRPIVRQYSDLAEIISRDSQVSFFMKAYVERISEKKGAISAYLVVPSGFDLPQDRAISLLVNNDISEGDQLFIVCSVNQQNNWNDEIQLAAKVVLPVHGELLNSNNSSSSGDYGYEYNSEKDEKKDEKKETPNTSIESSKNEVEKDEKPSENTEEDERINAILKNTMSEQEKDEFYG